MTYENILFDVTDGVATITLDRPDKLNAYTTEMGEEVTAAFRKVRGDDAVRAVILTGAGRGFCAGVDLERVKTRSDRFAEDFFSQRERELASEQGHLDTLLTAIWSLKEAASKALGMGTHLDFRNEIEVIDVAYVANEQ